MEKSKLDELGNLMGGLPHKHYGPEFKNRDEALDYINEQVTKAAMAESGVRADQLSDESQEDTPIVRLYWTTLSAIWAKVYMTAAQSQYFVPGLGG